MEGLSGNKMKKMLCSLLTVVLLVSCFVSCFAGTVNAAARASGKFDVTVKAGELKTTARFEQYKKKIKS